MRTPRRGARRRGVAMLLVLWIVVILTMMAYSVIYQMGVETRLSSLRLRSLEAQSLARAGLARGMVDLRNDLIADNGDASKPPFDAEGDVWAKPEEGKADIEMGAGTFNVVVRDEESLFNINRMNSANRVLLEKIIENIGYEEEDAKIVAAAIIDYADADDEPAIDNAPAKTEKYAYAFYAAEDAGESTDLEKLTKARIANEPFLTVEGLLDVYGVTPELFFGPETEEAIYYRERMGDAVGDRFVMETGKRRDPDEPILGLRDYFTVYGNGQLNVNTAPQHVLAALFEAAGRTDGDRAAETLIRDRRGGRRDDFDNDNVFKSGADLQGNASLGAQLGPILAIYPLGTASTTFTLTSTGSVGQVRQTVSATVERSLALFNRDESFELDERAEEWNDLYEDRRNRREDKKTERLARVPNVRVIHWRQ